MATNYGYGSNYGRSGARPWKPGMDTAGSGRDVAGVYAPPLPGQGVTPPHKGGGATNPFEAALVHSAKLRSYGKPTPSPVPIPGRQPVDVKGLPQAPQQPPGEVIAPPFGLPVATNFTSTYTDRPMFGEDGPGGGGPAGGGPPANPEQPPAGTPPPSGGKGRAVTPGTGGQPGTGKPPENPPEAQPYPTPPPNVEAIYGISLPEIMRMGGNADQYGTIVDWLADGTTRFGADAMRPYAEQLRRAPGLVTSYMHDMNAARSAGVSGIHFVDWLAHQGSFSSPLAGQMGDGSAVAAQQWQDIKRSQAGDNNVRQLGYHQAPPPVITGGQQNPPPTSNPQSTPSAPPPTGTGTPPPPAVPGATPSTPFTATPQGDPTLENFDAILERQITDYMNRMNPQFERQREDAQRRALHAGSLTGAINAGGFGETLNDALAAQYAQEQATVAPQITQLTMNAQGLAMEKFKTDMNAILTRENIRTNADLERSAQALQKYGIDTNKLIEEYKAQMALKGQSIAADAQINAAALHAAASQAAAQAQADASRYNAYLDFQTGVLGADVARENNLMDYILGIVSLGPEWAKLILGADPLGILTGNKPPSDIVVKP